MLEPVPASTVVICRITTKWPHKILLVKRSETAKFLPGAHVFPGGRLEENDNRFGSFLASDTKNLSRISPYFLGADDALAFVSAAIRETFEETGLSILRNAESKKLIDTTTLGTIIKGPGDSTIAPNLDTIWPISWWITPHGETRRFDTRFFLALIDDIATPAQHAPLNSEGISDVRWHSPTEALALYEAQAIFLAPPTRSILERMAKTESLEEFLGYVDCPMLPIHPHFIEDEEGNKVLILPGDSAHEEAQGPRMLLCTRYRFP